MKLRAVLVLILAICCVVSMAYADELANRFAIGGVVGGIFPKDSDIDDNLYLGGNLTYGINEYLAIGAEAGYMSWDDEANGVDYGDVRAVPLLGDVYLKYPMDVGGNQLVPYAIGGIGVIFWDYEESSLLTSNNISVNMDPELGIKIGGGVDYFFTKNLALNLEGGYTWSDADVSVSAFGTNAAATIDTDYAYLNAGLKYYF